MMPIQVNGAVSRPCSIGPDVVNGFGLVAYIRTKHQKQGKEGKSLVIHQSSARTDAWQGSCCMYECPKWSKKDSRWLIYSEPFEMGVAGPLASSGPLSLEKVIALQMHWHGR